MPAQHLPSTDESLTAASVPEPRGHADAAGAEASNGEKPTSPREQLQTYASLGGFTLTPDSHAWYAAADAVTTSEDARAASTTLAELRGRDLPAAVSTAARIAAETPLGEPSTAAELSRAVALLGRVRATLGKLRPEAYDADLDALAAATAGKGAGGESALSWGQRRTLLRQARKLAGSRWIRRPTLHAALAEAAEARTEWRSVAPDSRPELPADLNLLDGPAGELQEMDSGLQDLGRLLPGLKLADLPFAELSETLDRLAADEGTLYRLPNLHQLRADLEAAGLTALLEELQECKADAETAVAIYDAREGVPAARQPLSADPQPTATPAEAEPEADVEPAAEEESGVQASDEAEAVTDDAEAAADQEAEAAPDATEPAQEAEQAAEEPASEESTEDATEPEPVEPEPVEPEPVEAEAAATEPAEAIETVEAEPVAEPEAQTAEDAPEAAAPAEEEPAAEAADEAADEPAVTEATVTEPTEAAPEPAPEAAPEPTPAQTESAPEPAAEAADEAADESAAEAAAESEQTAEQDAPKRPRRPRRPSITPGRPITAYSPEELAALVRWIDSDYVTRTDDELLRATMKELGFARLGPRIKEALGAAVTEARSR